MPLSPEASTAVVQLYRGELGRMSSYARRMDTTTNWAISAAGGMTTVALSNDSIPHAIVLILLPYLLYFLMLEARRYRYYEMSRVLTRRLEQGYFADAIDGDSSGAWRPPVLEYLHDPRPPLDVLAAAGWRLRRNYLVINLAMLVAWLIKLELSGGMVVDPLVLLSRAAIGPVPGPLVVLGVLAYVAWLASLAQRAARSYPQGENW
jgi:uncharacterized membrane protein